MRIEGALPQQLLQVLSKSAIVQSLNIGDFIQGKVASLKDGMLLMKLMDGSSLTASVPQDVNIPEGALLTLQIGEPVGDQLTARIVNPDAGSKQASETQNLPDRISTQLQAFGEKSTDALVSKVISLIDKNPSLGVEKAAFLVANKMEPDQGMQDMIMKLAQKEFQIDSNLTSLRDQLVTALTESDKSSLELLIKPLLINQGLEQAVSSLAEKLISAQNTVPPDGSTSGNQAGQANQSGQANQTDQVKQLLIRDILEALGKTDIANKPVGRETIINMVKTVLADIKADRNPQSATLNLKIPDNNLNDAISEFMKSLEGIREKAESPQKPDPVMIKQLVEKVFEKAFIRAENGVTDPVDLGDKMKALKNVILFSDEALKLIDPKSAQAGVPVVRELQNALQFFNQANTYHAFVQIPLLINNHQTTGELYVMKRKSKRGKIDPNQFTLFISLNTQNLGLVETFLNASNRCVTINFRVEDEKLSSFVKAHYKVLYEALLKKGFKLAEMKCRLHSDDAVNLLNAEQKTEDILGMNTRLDLKI